MNSKGFRDEDGNIITIPGTSVRYNPALNGHLAQFGEDGTIEDGGEKSQFAPASGSTAYAAADHDHAGVYSPVDHDHTGVYSPVDHNHDSAYAAAEHNHDTRYAAKVHQHSDYDVVILTLADKIFNPSKERTWTTIEEVEVISGPSTGGNKYGRYSLYNLEHYADYATGDLIRLVKKSDNTKIYEGVVMRMETQPAGISVSIDLNAVTDTTDYYLQKAS